MDKLNINNILDFFGKIFVKEIYDVSVRRAHNIIDGKVNAPSLLKMHDNFHGISNENLGHIKEFAQETIMATLHNFFWMIEQSDDFDLVVKTKDGTISLKEISDGLYGEAYGEDGWIAKYSDYTDIVE